MENIVIYILLIVLIGAVFYLISLINKKKDDKNEPESIIALKEQINLLLNQNNDLRNMVDDRLAQTHKITQEQFGKTAGMMQNATSQTQKAMAEVHTQSQKAIADVNEQSQRIIREVTEKLTKLDETNKRVVDFSSQLQNLQDILKNPKQRGVLGEYYLEETLKNVLPPNSYQMQYAFKDGSIVDAIVRVKDKIIPIDSKFSLENYERILNCNNKETREKLEKQFKHDLKIRIDETSKYVKPNENTMDFAFMFIPSESIYYDLLVNKVGAIQVNTRDLIEYAFKDRRVIIVSPTSFLAYLQTVLQGLRALQIEEQAQEIRKGIEKMRRHMANYDNYFNKVGTSLGTTVSHWNNASKQFKLLDHDMAKVTDGEDQVEQLVLDKPKSE